ncbi:hypothetical protein VPH35_081177 [Triticum aestivum]
MLAVACVAGETGYGSRRRDMRMVFLSGHPRSPRRRAADLAGLPGHAADGGGSSNSSTQGKRLVVLELVGMGRRTVGDARPRRRREEYGRIRGRQRPIWLLVRRLAPAHP